MAKVYLPEPYGSLLALLGDIEEQVEIFGRQHGGHEFVTPILAELRTRLSALAMLTMLKGGTE
jgi:hypothetical protein